MKEYDKVRLCTDKYMSKGVGKGDIGYIIECYGGGHYEVEFSDRNTGITIAQIVAEEKDIEPTE